MKKRVENMIVICSILILAAVIFAACVPGQTGPVPSAPPAPGSTGTGGVTGGGAAADPAAAGRAYAVKTELRELWSVDPEKGIGVYGRYTELTAEDGAPEALARAVEEANARAKQAVEAGAERFLAENGWPAAAPDSAGDPFEYHNISYIVNVTRADDALISILETETESGIGDAEGAGIDAAESARFHASVYETESGRLLAPADFLKDPGTLGERLANALAGKYSSDGLFAGAGETPAWTADYLGLRFYLDGAAVPEEKRRELADSARGRALHVSIPYAALDGPMAAAAAAAPAGFIAQIEKDAEYALPYDGGAIRVEKAPDDSGNEAYRIVIRDKGGEKAWWLEYADDASDFFVFRARGAYYFYRLDDARDQAFVYNFASPDGGYDRFENQNAQCFDSFLHEIRLAVPCNPECVHMRERPRTMLKVSSRLSTSFTPNGHYSFEPEEGRGRTWLHFRLADDALALDSRNVGVRLLHEVRAVPVDEDGTEGEEIMIPAGEVLRFLGADGESELYFYMSKQYNMYHSGARDYRYDCALGDGRRVRLTTRSESSLFVDGMYLDRIGEPVTLGAARYEAGAGGVPEHFVEIGGKEYKLITDLSLRTEAGEEIDFAGDVWWEVENYVGSFASDDGGSRLVIAENGEVTFEFDGTTYSGKLPEKRYYDRHVEIYLEAGYEKRTFTIIVDDDLPPHDPSFGRIRFFSEGEPATNEPSRVPMIEVELSRE